MQIETTKLKCDDNCCTLVVDKLTWEDDSVSFSISIRDSLLVGKFGFWGRLRAAVKFLFKKPEYYAEVWVDGTPKNLTEFVSDFSGMVIADFDDCK